LTPRRRFRRLLVDDQAMVREGFGALLAAQPDIIVVGSAADGEEAVATSRRSDPDVVLMDIRMPKLDGLQATRRLLDTPPGTHRPRVLMLTTFDLDEYVFEALRAGASGFLLKDAPAAELVHAVRVVAAGEALLAPSVTRRLIEDYATRTRPARVRPAVLHWPPSPWSDGVDTRRAWSVYPERACPTSTRPSSPPSPSASRRWDWPCCCAAH
jgi:DNA-binding NarL/FixJ family response regulator